jgi:hypothetical protein
VVLRGLCFSGLAPDEVFNPDGGWPRTVKRFGIEAWCRNDAGELVDEEMYPSDAAWAGIFDRYEYFENDEYERRLKIAAEHGDPEDA